jgi:diguanylate cyclase
MNLSGHRTLQGVLVLSILAFSALSTLSACDSPLFKAYMLGLSAAGVAAVALSEIRWREGAGGGAKACPSVTGAERLLEREQEFNKLTNSVATLLREQANENSRFVENLGYANNKLAHSKGASKIHSIILNLLQENGNLSRKLKETTLSLEESRLQIQQLRSNLSVAEQAALRDALTELGNRRCFDGVLNEELAQAQESGTELCVSLGDVDDFKRINDNFGHLVGDEVLKLIAELLGQNTKRRDHVARFGGEEFAMIFPETRLDDATSVVDKIRQQVEAKQWAVSKSGERLGSVTMSFGVVGLKDGESAEELMDRVDSRLYEAKAAGKNRVVSDLQTLASIEPKKAPSGA